ncbi:hypothetical protein U1Q18_042035 [Sarracenia purpurea var. burkii]
MDDLKEAEGSSKRTRTSTQSRGLGILNEVIILHSHLMDMCYDASLDDNCRQVARLGMESIKVEMQREQEVSNHARMPTARIPLVNEMHKNVTTEDKDEQIGEMDVGSEENEGGDEDCEEGEIEDNDDVRFIY